MAFLSCASNYFTYISFRLKLYQVSLQAANFSKRKMFLSGSSRRLLLSRSLLEATFEFVASYFIPLSKSTSDFMSKTICFTKIVIRLELFISRRRCHLLSYFTVGNWDFLSLEYRRAENTSSCSILVKAYLLPLLTQFN